MSPILPSLKSLSLAILLCASAAAQADIVVFTDRAAFDAVISAAGTDSYDDLDLIPYDTPLFRTAGAYDYSASSGPNSVFFGAGEGGDMWLSTNVAGDAITFYDFPSDVKAVGGNFFGSDVLGAWLPGASVSLTATDGVDTVTYTIDSPTPDSFVGFLSTIPMTSLVLNTGAPTYWTTANNLTLAVPEPETYGMLLAGLALVGWTAGRRNK